MVAGLALAVVALLATALELRASSGPERSSTAEPMSAAPTVPSDLDGARLLTSPLVRPGGGSVSIADLAGSKAVVINLWAQWCAPCVAEMPILERVHRSNDRVVFVGVNEGDSAEQAAAMARRTGISYDWALDDDGGFATSARTINLPTTLLITADGHVAATKVGAFHSASELERWIASGIPPP